MPESPSSLDAEEQDFSLVFMFTYTNLEHEQGVSTITGGLQVVSSRTPSSTSTAAKPVCVALHVKQRLR